jgi:hypothetical protein
MQLQFLARSTPLGLALQQHLDGTGEAVDLQANPGQTAKLCPLQRCTSFFFDSHSDRGTR